LLIFLLRINDKGLWGSLDILRRSGRRNLSSNLSNPMQALQDGGESLKEVTEKLTRYERARIVGARALQISMGAPTLIESSTADPIDMALEELKKGVIPITIKRRGTPR